MSLLRCFCFCGWATQKLHRPRVSCVGIYACVPFAFGGSSPTPSPSRRHRPLTPEASHLIDVVTHNAICCCLQCWPPLLRFYRARSRSLCSTAGISLRSGSPMKRKRFSSGEGTLTGVKRYIVDMYVIVLCVFFVRARQRFHVVGEVHLGNAMKISARFVSTLGVFFDAVMAVLRFHSAVAKERLGKGVFGKIKIARLCRPVKSTSQPSQNQHA